MSQGFIITGMPLSHLAWMAVFLTTDRSACYPQPLKDMQEPRDIERLMDTKGYEYVGIADTALVFFPDVLEELHCPILLLDRPDEESFDGLLRMNVYPDVAREFVVRCRAAVKRLKNMAGVLTIDNAVSRDRVNAQNIFWHCLPGLGFDVVRYDLLRQVEIIGNPFGAVSAAQKNLSGMQKLFKDRYEHLSMPLQ